MGSGGKAGDGEGGMLRPGQRRAAQLVLNNGGPNIVV